MTAPKEHVRNQIFARWRSQTLHAGVDLGVFELVGEYPKHAVEITDRLDIDRELGYRLLRGLASLELLEEHPDRRFSITPAGEFLREDHPESLRGVALLEAGPTLTALWTHLPDLVREGEQNAFEWEFGHSGSVEHREANPAHDRVFNEAMTSYSKMQSAWTQEILADVDFSAVSHVCDVGGGRGHLLCTLLAEYPELEGTVLELPIVVEAEAELLAPTMGVEDRCSYVAGDMFESVPEAEVYLLKHILHDYDDEECTQILSTIRESAPADCSLFAIEHIIPEPGTSHFAKLFDLHMLVATTGRERTAEEYAALLENAGWAYVETHYPENELIGAVEAVPN